VQPTVLRHRGGVSYLTFSPDGRLLAAAGMAAAAVWDADTGKRQLFCELPGPGFDLRTPLVFSPDGKTLAMNEPMGLEPATALWDVESGRRKAAVRWSPPMIDTCMAFSPDGKTLALTGLARPIILCDAQTGNRQAVLDAGGQRVQQLAFGPDGSTLALVGHQAPAQLGPQAAARIGGGGAAIRLWDFSQRRLKQTLSLPSETPQFVVFSPDGSKLASASEQSIKLWDVETGKLERTRPLLFCQAMAFLGDGKRLVIHSGVSQQLTIAVWDLQTDQFQRTLRSGQGPDPCCPSRDLQSDQVLRTLEQTSPGMLSASLSPEGTTVAVPDSRAIRLFDTQTGKELAALGGTRLSPAQIAPGPMAMFGPATQTLVFSPDGAKLALGDPHGDVYLWDVNKARSEAPPESQAGSTTAPQKPPGQGARPTLAKPALRLWTSADGKHTAKAELVDVADGAVTLRKADGTQVEVSLADLSPEDRRFAEEWESGRAAVAPDRSEAVKALRQLTARFRTSGGRITRIDLSRREITDEDLGNLQPFADLESLNLAGTAITDAGLRHVGKLTALTTLDLSQTDVTDAGLEHLQGLTNLETLALTGTGASDRGAAELRRLPKLDKLDFQPVVWSFNVLPSGDRTMFDMTGVAVRFEGIPAPPGPSFGQIQVSGPAAFGSTGGAQLGSQLQTTSSSLVDGVATIVIQSNDQRYKLELKYSGRMLVIGDAQTFDLSGKKKQIAINPQGVARVVRE
jgi:WD40 repeat protein